MLTEQRPFDNGSYPFAVGRIRVLESTLLDRAKWNRLQDAETEEQGVRLLREFGYGGTEDTLDSMIRYELSRAQSLIREISPDPELSNLFLLPTDAHNLKALLKAKRMNQTENIPILDGGCFDPELLETCVHTADYRLLGETLGQELEGINELTHPGELSAKVDRAIYAYIIQTVRRRKLPLLVQYFETQISCINQLSRLRAEKLGWDEQELSAMLLPLPLQDRTDFSYIPELLEETTSPVQAEQIMNRRLMNILRTQSDDSFGIAPLLLYLTARRQEATALRVLFSAKKSGQAIDIDSLLS